MDCSEGGSGVLVQEVSGVGEVEEGEITVGDGVGFSRALAPVLVSVGGKLELLCDWGLEEGGDGDGGEDDEDACEYETAGGHNKCEPLFPGGFAHGWNGCRVIK